MKRKETKATGSGMMIAKWCLKGLKQLRTATGAEEEDAYV
jgi:hypothetical protein